MKRKGFTIVSLHLLLSCILIRGRVRLISATTLNARVFSNPKYAKTTKVKIKFTLVLKPSDLPTRIYRVQIVFFLNRAFYVYKIELKNAKTCTISNLIYETIKPLIIFLSPIPIPYSFKRFYVWEKLKKNYFVAKFSLDQLLLWNYCYL